MKTDNIAKFLTSTYWFVLSLSLAFLCYYALNRGAADTWIHICGFFVLLNLLLKKNTWKQLFNRPVLFIIAVFLFLITISVLFGSGTSHHRNIIGISEMIILVLGIHCFSLKESDYNRYYYFFLVLLLITAGWHVFSFYPSPIKYVKQTNRNILSNFLIMLIPLLAFYLITLKKRKQYFLIIIVALMTVLCLDMLLKSQARPAILGLFLSCFFLLCFIKGKKKVYWLLSVAGFIGLLVATNYADIFINLKDLAVNIFHEERVLIWSDSVHMISESRYIEMLLGHGLGSFRYVFSEFSSVASNNHYAFPHNFFLQLLYESGFLGLTMVAALFAFIAYMLIRVIRTNPSYRINVFSKCLLAYYLAWVFHCSLTVPLFSKYTLYPLAFTVGAVNILYQTAIKSPPEKNVARTVTNTMSGENDLSRNMIAFSR